MTYTGQVIGGKVVFDGPVPLPEGTAVRIEPAAIAMPEGSVPEPAGEKCIPTLYDRYKDVIGKAVGLPEDFALNHDHYIHGTPKR